MSPSVAISASPLALGVVLMLGACSADPEAAPPTLSTSETSETTPPLATDPATAPQSQAEASPSATMPAIDPASVDERLRFDAATSSGESFSGLELAGQDSILWFWASWCPTCQAEAPAVAEAIRELPEGVTLYGVPGKSESADIQAFIDTYGLGDVVHIVDADGTLWPSFDVPYQPAYTFINDDGDIRTVQGSIGKSGILDAADDLVSR